jgi:hypothetical protein
MAKRILYLGKDYWRHASARSALFHTRFYHGLVRNGHFVHYFSGPTESSRLAPFGLKKIGRARAKERLLTIAKNFEPEAIVASQVGEFYDVLLELKSRMPHLRIAQMNVDPLFSTGNRENLLRSRSAFDATFVTTGGSILQQFSTATNAFYFVPNVTDTSIDTGRAFEKAQPTYDLCCFLHGAHQAKGDQERRIAIAERAARDIPKERLLFGGFHGWPSRYGRPYFDGIANTAMTLNLNRDRWNGVLATPEERYLYTSDRTAHTMGNGSLALVERGYALEKLYSEEEMVFFADAEELAEKVNYYRAHPAERQRIAKNGWERAHRDFNERVIMQYVMERLFSVPLSRDYAWPTA